MFPELGLAGGKRDRSGERSGWFAELGGADPIGETTAIRFGIE